MYLPSGVNVGDWKCVLALSRVTWRGLVPSALAIQTLSDPERSLTKTTSLPSGE